jgi:hypothetical protein
MKRVTRVAGVRPTMIRTIATDSAKTETDAVGSAILKVMLRPAEWGAKPIMKLHRTTRPQHTITGKPLTATKRAIRKTREGTLPERTSTALVLMRVHIGLIVHLTAVTVVLVKAEAGMATRKVTRRQHGRAHSPEANHPTTETMTKMPKTVARVQDRADLRTGEVTMNS